jgi:hypothetical protein
MLRTLHTRPENEYLLWDDSHADKQPQIVKDVFKRIYDGLNKKQQAVFNRAIGHVRPDRQNGRDLYDALRAVLEQSGMPRRNESHVYIRDVTCRRSCRNKVF